MDVRRVAVGSTNRAKVRAVRLALAGAWPEAEVLPVGGVASGVPAMPWGDAQGMLGALTRARAALEATDADVGVGLEGAVVEAPAGAPVAAAAFYLTAWAAVVDRAGRQGVGGGFRLPLPEALADDLRRGAELGPLVDALAAEMDTRQRGGAVGLLTGGLLERDEGFAVAVRCALAPWRSALYGPRD